MASLRDIRKRIKSVKSTQQITKAMKMVAAAKLRKAQDAIIAARPYAQMLEQIIRELSERSDGEVAHPLLQARPNPKRAELLVLTSDRGLAGGFNSNLLRRANRFISENQKGFEKVYITTIGRKGNDFFRKRGMEVRKDYPGLFTKVSYRTASDLGQETAARFLSGEVDVVYLAYNEFVSAMTQKPDVVQLLPFQALPPDKSADAQAKTAFASVDFKYEPARQDVLNQLVPQALAIKLFRSLLESSASEQGARMSAMENATSNASDMIGKLTLFYNRSRQAVITKELMEIVSGAEALK